MWVIDLPETIKWDVLAEKLIQSANNINPGAPGVEVFKGDAAFTGHTVYGEALLYYLNTLVEKTTCKAPLYPLYSFAWTYYNQTKLTPHLDKEENHWLCTITVEQDTDWPFSCKFGDHVITHSSKVGRMMIVDGAKAVHWRDGPYNGNRFISLILGFVEQHERAYDIQQLADLQPYDKYAEYEQIAKEINLDPKQFPGFQDNDKPRFVDISDIVDLPSFYNPNTTMFECARNTLRSRLERSIRKPYNRNFIDGNAGKELIELQNAVRDIIQPDYDKKLLCGDGRGVIKVADYKNTEPYLYKPMPQEDVIVICPLIEPDEPKKRNIVSVLNGYPNSYLFADNDFAASDTIAILNFRLFDLN